jgi:hypothetical protein
MKRIALLLLLVSSCSDDGVDEANAPLVTDPEKAERVECAIGEDSFAPACTVERAVTADGLTLTLRGPAGGFRRLLVTKDGRGVVAADGADQAVVTPLGPDRIEVAVAGERYRLPATVKQ